MLRLAPDPGPTCHRCPLSQRFSWTEDRAGAASRGLRLEGGRAALITRAMNLEC